MTQNELWEDLADIGSCDRSLEEFRSVIETALSAGSPDARLAAVSLASELTNGATLLIERAALERNELVRAEIAEELAGVPEGALEMARSVLTNMVAEDPAPLVRKHAALSLVELSGSVDSGFLMERLRTEGSSVVRASIAVGLLHLGYPLSDQIRRFLASKQEKVRRNVANALIFLPPAASARSQIVALLREAADREESPGARKDLADASRFLEEGAM